MTQIDHETAFNDDAADARDQFPANDVRAAAIASPHFLQALQDCLQVAIGCDEATVKIHMDVIRTDSFVRHDGSLDVNAIHSYAALVTGTSHNTVAPSALAADMDPVAAALERLQNASRQSDNESRASL